MPATPEPAVRPLRAVRRALDHLERLLRRMPGPRDTQPSRAATGRDPRADGHRADGHLDGATTRELLVPAATSEPAARRANRQAQDYLARRRRRLQRQLEER